MTEQRYLVDLININENERDIIIQWAKVIDRDYELQADEEALLKRFTDWKEQRENVRTDH